MTTRDEAIDAAGLAFAQALHRQAQMTPREQAEAAFTPTGPSVDELEDRIRVARGLEPLDRSTPLPTLSSSPSQEAS